MTSISPSIHDTGQRVVTIRQQINNLMAWNKSQENKLILQKSAKSSSTEKHAYKNSSSLQNTQSKNDNSFYKIEEQPLIPAHSNFEALLDAKLREETSSEPKPVDKPVQKRSYLKKGQGLSRFRMKPEDFKLNTRSRSSISKESTPHLSLPWNNVNRNETKFQKRTEALQAFETLEEQANNSSFCSTSSMVEQLMEESIKSTPIKIPIPDTQNEKYMRIMQEQFACRTENEENFEYYGIRTLDIIDEEPSKECTMDSQCNVVMVNRSAVAEYDDPSDTENGSKCSCCLDNSQYMSTSLSVYEETTTVYTPLKETLRNRIKELEVEIDAFRSENAHLCKLRSEYEMEYGKFCKEKTEILNKIREEHITELKELELEKKKLQREKSAFEKHLKDAKHRPNKEEKEEIRLLKEEIKNLRQKMNEKEGRSAAAQARIRTDMKQLKNHNAKLKEEIEKLRKSSKSVTFAPIVKKTKSSSNIISRIDGELEKTQKSIAEKFKTPPESPDSGLDTMEESKLDLHVDTYPNGDVSENRRNDDSNALEIYDDLGNREKLYPDGRKDIWYPNGNVKKISADGKVSKIIYYNGDVKETSSDLKMVKYFYAESKIWHSEYEDGLEIMEFPNGQVEKRYRGQSIEVVYPNGTVYSLTASGDKMWANLDGTITVHYADRNEKKIFFPNKQVETHTPEYKKREYPDGTTKTIYVNGMQETKYPNGRVRLKTKDGRLLSDSEVT